MQIDEIRQMEQWGRHQTWVVAEGGKERPQWLSTFFKPEQVKRLDWLKKRVVPDILEVGCNIGYVLSYVDGQAGVDISEESIAIARRLGGPRDFRVGNALDLPFPTASFATVLLSEVLEHLRFEDVPQAIAEARRVATALILVTIPNGDRDGYESNCFRHQWLATKEIVGNLFPGVRLEKVGPFYCLRVLQ